MADTYIGSVRFLDGVNRDVYLDAHGRQYVIGPDGNRVYGVWILIDEPEIVPRAEGQ